VKRFGLIGHPLTHSFSGKYFTDKFQTEGLKDHVYELFPIPSIDDLPGLLKNNPDLCGLNVTIPYKQLVLPFLDESRLPGNIHACNCIKISNGKLYGYNTDVTGFEKTFTPLLKFYHTSALVLGNGGATAAVKYVLEKFGITCNIVSRKMHEGSKYVYEDLNEEIMQENLVVINTTPLGTYPDVNASAPIPYQFISKRHYFFDLVYNPSKTTFLKNAEEKGAAIRNGYDMLVAQAEESWKIWNA
jgi:shikimate dehydrogenase